MGVNPPASPTISLSPFHAATLTSIEVDSNFLSGTPVTLFDEIRIGNSFADVVAVPVPEPSTLLLAGAAGLGGVIVRRRRKGEGN